LSNISLQQKEAIDGVRKEMEKLQCDREHSIEEYKQVYHKYVTPIITTTLQICVWKY